MMVDRVRRRRVNLRVTVTEGEIDRYLQQNRDKLETGLTFYGAAHPLPPHPNRGRGRLGATRRSEPKWSTRKILAGGEFAELAREYSQDGSGKDGGSLGALKRGELAPEIEKAILDLSAGEDSCPVPLPGGATTSLSSTRRRRSPGMGSRRRGTRSATSFCGEAPGQEWLAEIRQARRTVTKNRNSTTNCWTAPMTGCVGTRKLVSISGWAKHAILYEFVSLEAVEKHFVDNAEWSRRVVRNLIHAPHSPGLGVRIWPPA